MNSVIKHKADVPSKKNVLNKSNARWKFHMGVAINTQNACCNDELYQLHLCFLLFLIGVLLWQGFYARFKLFSSFFSIKYTWNTNVKCFANVHINLFL